MSQFDPPARDPRAHWMTRFKFVWSANEEDDPATAIIGLDEEIAEKRERLAESDAHGDPGIYMPQARALVIASVLEESAARLRLAAEAGDPAGSTALAQLADDLAEDIWRRPGRAPEDEM
jgi:hypothetical protein